MTRSLYLGYKLLNTRWTAGETVDVYAVTSGASIEDPAVYTKVGTLTASDDGGTTTLTGTGCNGICKGTISVAPGTISGNYP